MEQHLFTVEDWSFWFLFIAPHVLNGCFPQSKYYKHFMKFHAITKTTLQYSFTECQDQSPPNVFIGTIGPDLGSAFWLSPSVTGVHALGVSFGGYPSCYSSWGTSFPSILDYIHISVIM